MILQWLDPPRNPIVEGFNSLETVVGKFCDPPCEELDIRSGRVIIYWLPGIKRFSWDIFEGTKTRGSGRSCFVCQVKPGASSASSGIQWINEWIVL
jgi:hypothetical protein